jgi:type IV pilus assembly protein PilM
MIWNPFKTTSKRFLGIDIGTHSIKIVELSQAGKRKKLENYGEMSASALYEKSFRTFEKNTLSVSSAEVGKTIRAIIQEAAMKSQKAYFSIPDFSSFFTTLKLPSMSQEELPRAVQYQARQHIPLPLSEVTLDWQVLGEGKVLLVAVPSEIIYQYQKIARDAQLELLTMEAEVFSLTRALVGQEKVPFILVDIGARSTTISIIDGGQLRLSHSFDIAGGDFTDTLSRGLSMDYKNAEELKQKQGLLSEGGRKSFLPLIDMLLEELRKVSHDYFLQEQRNIQKIIIAGGSAHFPGLKEYFSESLAKTVEIANPFTDLYYPPILETVLKKMGPSYAVAVGAALSGLLSKK